MTIKFALSSPSYKAIKHTLLNITTIMWMKFLNLQMILHLTNDLIIIKLKILLKFFTIFKMMGFWGFGVLGFWVFFERNKKSTRVIRVDLDSWRLTEFKGEKMACLRCKLWILWGKGTGSKFIFGLFRGIFEWAHWAHFKNQITGLRL